MDSNDSDTGNDLSAAAALAWRTVLLVGPRDDEYRGLERLLRRWNCLLHRAQTYQDALSILHENRVVIVICDEELPDGHWTDFLDAAHRRLDPPLLIVASRTATSRTFECVREAGGYDLLLKPFDADEVRITVTSGIRQWHQRPPVHGAGSSG